MMPKPILMKNLVLNLCVVYNILFQTNLKKTYKILSIYIMFNGNKNNKAEQKFGRGKNIPIIKKIK